MRCIFVVFRKKKTFSIKLHASRIFAEYKKGRVKKELAKRALFVVSVWLSQNLNASYNYHYIVVRFLAFDFILSLEFVLKLKAPINCLFSSAKKFLSVARSHVMRVLQSRFCICCSICKRVGIWLVVESLHEKGFIVNSVCVCVCVW